VLKNPNSQEVASVSIGVNKMTEKEREKALKEYAMFDEPFNGIYLDKSPKKEYKIREAYLEVKRLGRPLTKKEMERFAYD